jgi:indoleamine 2,3-dioxygenase
MKAMWNRSKPAGYTTFRTFIFGITSQSMFPNGVIYEGVSEEPMSFRGESGANDSMVRSLSDSLFLIDLPIRFHSVTTFSRSQCLKHP